MWYSGIDQHKAYCVITTYGPEGPRVKQARVASTPLALQQYFAESPGPQQAVVESTGAWYWLADTLAGVGVELVLAHATRGKAIAAAKVKTDKVDSNTLALLLRADRLAAGRLRIAAEIRAGTAANIQHLHAGQNRLTVERQIEVELSNEHRY